MTVRVLLLKCYLHPDTRRSELHETMLRIFKDRNPTMIEEILAFNEEHQAGLILDAEVLCHDHRKDPICGLFATFKNETIGLYFKLWFDPAQYPV
jgi:hypothetical protein